MRVGGGQRLVDVASAFLNLPASCGCGWPRTVASPAPADAAFMCLTFLLGAVVLAVDGSRRWGTLSLVQPSCVDLMLLQLGRPRMVVKLLLFRHVVVRRTYNLQLLRLSASGFHPSGCLLWWVTLA